MRGLKFTNSDYVDYLVRDKTIRLASFSYYRRLEGSEWIRDNQENTTRVTVDLPDELDIVNDHEARERLARNGVRLTDNLVSIKNSSITHVGPDDLVFCLSLDPFEAARKAMCDDAPPGESYDACVEIPDIDAFIDAVINTGILSDGRRISEICGQVSQGPVVYDKRDTNALTEEIQELTPFKKASAFVSQQEYRIVFLGSARAKLETATVKFEFGELPVLFRRDTATPRVEMKPRQSFDEAAAVLFYANSILIELKQSNSRLRGLTPPSRPYDPEAQNPGATEFVSSYGDHIRKAYRVTRERVKGHRVMEGMLETSPSIGDYMTYFHNLDIYCFRIARQMGLPLPPGSDFMIDELGD